MVRWGFVVGQDTLKEVCLFAVPDLDALRARLLGIDESGFDPSFYQDPGPEE